jgi:hypothetical protein
VQPATGWEIVDSSSDVGGGISPDNSVTTSCICSGGGCNSPWNYTYFGNFSGSNKVIFSDQNGVQVPHYQIRIVYWMVLIDSWQGTDQIFTTL